MDPNTVADHLKCPVCFEIPSKEIYQCTNGHTICSVCCASITACPQCRLPYGAVKIRTRALESVLDSMQFECMYKGKGCTILSKRNELNKHIQCCTQGDGEIPLKMCKLIGYECSFKLTFSRVSESLKHFQDEHEIPICTEPQGVLHFCNFADETRNFIWTPVIVQIKKEECVSPSFIVVGMVQAEDKRMSWGCLFLGESNEDASKFCLELQIQNKLNELPVLKWRIPAVPCFQANEVFNSAASKCKVSLLPLLLQNYLEEGNLNVTFKITREEGNVSETKFKPSTDLQSFWLFGVNNTGKESSLRVQNDVVFEEWTCDGCSSTRITGKVFMCLFCPNFVICTDCMERNVHVNHIFGLCDDLSKAHFMMRKSCHSSGGLLVWKGILPLYVLPNDTSTKEPEVTPVFTGVRCNGCRQSPIKAIRYKCLQCLNYDLCENCLMLGNHPDHIFAVIKTKLQDARIRHLMQIRSPLMK